jgi:hypothetical protein
MAGAAGLPIVLAAVGLTWLGAEAQGPGAGLRPAASETDAATAFERKVSGFVYELFLSGKRLSDDEMRRLYADRVLYFDGRALSRRAVMADKRAFYARWPERSYRLLGDTLRIVPRRDQPRVYDVRFEYTFDVAGPGRRSRGRGVGFLTLDLATEDGRVTRETGRVLERW